MLNFVTVFSIVPILKSLLLHGMKLLHFLVNTLTFADNISKIIRNEYIFLCIALAALNSTSQFKYKAALNEGFSNSELGFSFTDENVLAHESQSLYL